MAVSGKINMAYLEYSKFKIKFIIILSLIILFQSCLMGINYDIQGESIGRKWTFIIYMAADNDLESAAIANFNELEAVRYGSAPISILVLLDRSPHFDQTNGNWTDTRLFEIKSDPGGLTATMKSPRLNCPELGLSKDTETNLNTADPMVLSRLIDFAKRVYPAEHYALFMWGHGTGWRSSADIDSSYTPQKAIAFDDTVGQYMSLPAFGRAITDKGLSMIGFDTCFGAVLEVVYQIKNSAELFVGSQGLILSTGWNYTALFTDFLKKPNLSINDLGDSIQKQFSERYAGLANASISQIQLAQVENLFINFNNFSGVIADSITTGATRDIVRNQILNNIEKHFFTSFPSDLYIDISDFKNKILAISVNITSNNAQQTAIANSANELGNALSLAIPASWAYNGTSNKIGVHVIPIVGIGVPAATHELEYIRDSIAIDKNAFVQNSLHWVPNALPRSNSLLDKLFYWVF